MSTLKETVNKIQQDKDELLYEKSDLSIKLKALNDEKLEVILVTFKYGFVCQGVGSMPEFFVKFSNCSSLYNILPRSQRLGRCPDLTGSKCRRYIPIFLWVKIKFNLY